ncbi:dihydrofolate reductase [Bacillus piscicola]|uniref:dihydrofolate reductase n=1 Tax=Bacillus piscicola TaxID=1632684 RepID=UPI001F08B169|nr:dihydrofolate reductase [Bacillus piscicola]
MIAFVVAMDKNRVIGNNNDIPWHLPADLRHFKEVTTGHPIVMGRKTYESIGRPLPGRRNIIMTGNRDYQAPGCDIVSTVEEVLDISKTQETHVIGGETLFEQFFPHAEKLYLTIIHDAFTGDTFFPKFDEEEWNVVDRKEGPTDDKNKYPHTYYTLTRKME